MKVVYYYLWSALLIGCGIAVNIRLAPHRSRMVLHFVFMRKLLAHVKALFWLCLNTFQDRNDIGCIGTAISKI